MFFALDIVAMILLMTAFILSEKGSKSFACAVVFIVYLVNMRFELSTYYPLALEVFGYYITQAFFEVLVAILLSLKPSREGVIIMGLCLMSVFINLISWMSELTGVYMGGFANIVMWALFAVQLAILFSKDFTDVIYGCFAKSSVVRDLYPGYSKNGTKG